jgi:hypothetical protein
MLHQLLSKQTRGRLAYAAMSLLVAWHTVAMVLASAPQSHTTLSGRWFFYPYLTLFRLDNNWGFFAPNVPRGHQFRYVIEDATGRRHTFIPDEKLSRLSPTWIWFNDRYITVIESPEDYADATAAALCREHASLHPVAVTLLDVEQEEFLPADRLSGKHPLDPEFVNVNVVKTVRCPGP